MGAVHRTAITKPTTPFKVRTDGNFLTTTTLPVHTSNTFSEMFAFFASVKIVTLNYLINTHLINTQSLLLNAHILLSRPDSGLLMLGS